MPYPSRVPGTEMWQKARDHDAATAAAAISNAAITAATVTTAPTRGRGRGRGGIKRKPAGDPDGVPTPKRSTRNTTDDILAASVAPVPAKGLLASAAEADLPAETPFEDVSPGATPEPSSFMATLSSKIGPNLDDPREKSPPLPRNLNDPDEYGIRLYNSKPSMRAQAANSRLLAPLIFEWDDIEIGFRDSQNDSSKGHTVTKRGKYLDKPNSNGMHFDYWCIGYDYSKTRPQDFDQELVKKHGVHPKYGIFLENSNNEQEEPSPYKMPGKPVVYLAEPSGRISHASRAFLSTVNHRRTFDNPYRARMNAAVRRFCKMDGVDLEEISVDEYMPTLSELKARSLGTAKKELESRPIMTESESEGEYEHGAEVNHNLEEEKPAGQPEEPCAEIFTLIAASEYVDSQAAVAPLPPAPEPPKKQQKYDAIRDIFVSDSSQSEPQRQRHVRNEDASALNIFAMACDMKGRRVPETLAHYERPRTGYAATQYAPEAQVPISNEREMYDRPPISHERDMYERPPISNERETYDRPPVSSERELYDRAVPYPAPRSSEAPYPMSSERDASHIPPTPTQAYRDPRISVDNHPTEAPRRVVDAIPAQSAYPAARQPEPPVEISPYGRQPEHPVEAYPYARQPAPPSEASSYGRQPIPEPPSHPTRPYEQPAPYPPQTAGQAAPSHAPSGPPHEYRAPYGYGPPPHEQAAYPPQPQTGYSQHDQRDQREYRDPREPPMPSQGRPYDSGYEDRRMSGYSESPTLSRPHWPQPGGQPPPPAGPTQAAQAPLPPATPSQTSGYPLPPPPSRGPFSAQASAEPLPPLRPSRGRLLGAAPEESVIDPAMRQGSQSGFSSFYSSTPSRGFQNNYPPPERMMGTPQQGHMGSPPYGPPSVSPPLGTIVMHQSPEEGRGIFRHRASHSGSGPPGSAAQNNKYRQLQPAPIPPHRNWSSKPELKTIPYDHKAPDGNTAQLPNSGPTTIRGWQVNPQNRRAQQAQREKMLGKPYEPPANEKEDSR